MRVNNLRGEYGNEGEPWQEDGHLGNLMVHGDFATEVWRVGGGEFVSALSTSTSRTLRGELLDPSVCFR